MLDLFKFDVETTCEKLNRDRFDSRLEFSVQDKVNFFGLWLILMAVLPLVERIVNKVPFGWFDLLSISNLPPSSILISEAQSWTITNTGGHQKPRHNYLI